MSAKDSAIGIDLGGTNLKGIVMDREGKCRHLSRVPTEAYKGAGHVLENILSLIDKLIEQEGRIDNLGGVGIGTPGFVGEDGSIAGGAANLPGWKGTQLLAPIRKRFGLPATAANDGTITALAEARFGAGEGVDNMVCLALGTGIGGGIIMNGSLCRGTYGMAAELGHVPVETNGIQCNCGLRGCAEQYGSATGIVNLARQTVSETSLDTAMVKTVRKDPSALTSKLVYDFVKKKDAAAILVHEQACEMLARLCGIISISLSPDRIILGGGVMKAGRIIMDETAKRYKNYCWPDHAERTDFQMAKLGEDAGVIGAAALVFEDVPH